MLLLIPEYYLSPTFFYAFWFTFEGFVTDKMYGKKNILELTTHNSCPQTLNKEGYSEKNKSKNNTNKSSYLADSA